jgi:hypothetical protein
MFRRAHRLVGAVAAALLLVSAACGDDGAAEAAAEEPPSTTAAAEPDPTTTPDATTETSEDDAMIGTDAMFPEGLRDVRYCEVLLLSEQDGSFTAEVYNTLGLSECPQEAWDALDPAAITAERGVLTTVLNGPRYWTLDTIVPLGGPAAERQLDRFGELDMFLAATIDLGTELPSGESYVDRSIVRETIFRFKEGSEIYVLRDPEGTRYVMQAYSHFVDDTQTIDTLPTLGDRLALPEGWTFEVLVLDHQLDLLSTDGVATVIQDELQNTYQRVDQATIDALDPEDREAYTA